MVGFVEAVVLENSVHGRCPEGSTKLSDGVVILVFPFELYLHPHSG